MSTARAVAPTPTKWMRVSSRILFIWLIVLTDGRKVLGNGKYKLRKENGEKIKKMYDEGDLGIKPKLV